MKILLRIVLALVASAVLVVVAIPVFYVWAMREAARIANAPRIPVVTPSVQTHPHLTRRVHTLSRQALYDPEPALVFQAIMCESSRLEPIVGPGESLARVSGANDTAFRFPEDEQRMREFSAKLGGMGFGSDGPLCDSLNALIATEILPDGLPPDSLTQAERELLRRLRTPKPR